MAIKEMDYLKRVYKKMNGSIKITSQYLGSDKPITYICLECNVEKTISRAGELVRKKKGSNACKKCFLKKLNQARSKKSQEKILNKLNEYKLLKVMGMRKQEGKDQRWMVSLNCSSCNYSWDVPGTNITRINDTWKGCPKCWLKDKDRIRKSNELLMKARIKRVKRTKEEFFTYMKDRTDIKMIGSYVNKKRTTSFQCNKCSHIWSTTPAHIQHTQTGCPLCNTGFTEAKNTYIKSVREVHGNDIKVLGEYVNSKTKIGHLCMRCNEPFKAAPNHIRKGSGCPHCHISKGEERIRRHLQDNDTAFIREWKEHTCRHYKLLPMDFYLPEYNVVIEFHGIQHKRFTPRFHKTEADLFKQQKRDLIKRNYCNRNGIKLIEIWFNEMDKIEEILDDELFSNLHKIS
ncbi:hypothetical protein [Priestia aryabhattai]